VDRLDYISLIFANPDEDAVSAYYDDLVVYKGTKITFNGLSNGLLVELWDEAGSLVHRKLASSSSLILMWNLKALVFRLMERLRL